MVTNRKKRYSRQNVRGLRVVASLSHRPNKQRLVLGPSCLPGFEFALRHDWSVKKCHCRFNSQVEGVYETHVRQFVESAASQTLLTGIRLHLRRWLGGVVKFSLPRMHRIKTVENIVSGRSRGGAREGPSPPSIWTKLTPGRPKKKHF